MSLYTETILPPQHGRGLPRWAIAALIVIALHLGIGAWFVLTRHLDMPPGEPPDALMINLAPVETSPPKPQPQEQKPQPEPEKPLESVPETPPVMSTPPELPQPVPTILQTPVLPAPEAVVAPPEAAKPVPDKHLEVEKRLEKEKIEKQKRLERQKRELKEKAERAEKARLAARQAAPAPGARGQSTASWASEVLARINAAKRYPEAARAARESGTATLTFVVDPNGRVVSPHIARSSGSSALDRETLALAYRLGRLPPPPNGRTPISVPVRYSIQ